MSAGLTAKELSFYERYAGKVRYGYGTTTGRAFGKQARTATINRAFKPMIFTDPISEIYISISMWSVWPTYLKLRINRIDNTLHVNHIINMRNKIGISILLAEPDKDFVAIPLMPIQNPSEYQEMHDKLNRFLDINKSLRLNYRR